MSIIICQPTKAEEPNPLAHSLNTKKRNERDWNSSRVLTIEGLSNYRVRLIQMKKMSFNNTKTKKIISNEKICHHPSGRSFRCKSCLMFIFFKSIHALSMSLFFPSMPNIVLNVLSLIFFSTCMTSMLCLSFLFIQYVSSYKILTFFQFGSPISSRGLFPFGFFPRVIPGMFSNYSCIVSTSNSKDLFRFSTLSLNALLFHQGWSIGK